MQRIQLLAIVCSLILFWTIFSLVRRKKLKTEYSLIWLTVSFIFIVFSIWRDGIDVVARIVGVDYPPSILFIVLLIGIILLLIEFSIIISKQAEKIKVLAQEIALLKNKLENNLEDQNEKQSKNT